MDDYTLNCARSIQQSAAAKSWIRRHVPAGEGRSFISSMKDRLKPLNIQRPETLELIQLPRRRTRSVVHDKSTETRTDNSVTTQHQASMQHHALDHFPNSYCTTSLSPITYRPVYTCRMPGCEQQFDRREQARDHFGVHDDIEWECEIPGCPQGERGFVRIYDYWDHVKDAHEKFASVEPFGDSSRESDTEAVRNMKRRTTELAMGTKNNAPQSLKSDLSIERDTESDTSAETGGSSAVSDIDSAEKIKIHRAQLVDRLMVLVYDMFNPADSLGTRRHAGAGSNNVLKARPAIVGSQQKSGKKRGSHESQKNEDEGIDDDENDFPKRRRGASGQHDKTHQEPFRKLACPYYQREPRKCHKHRACSGPGWDTVHRLKYVLTSYKDVQRSLTQCFRGHLYRSHAMTPHCGRCYMTFEKDAQVTEHLRLYNTCIVRTPILLDGFNKDQERQLKGRRTMFQAGSEEEKWKIVYLILFPDTPLGELPSPCEFCLVKLWLRS
jgi:hypothetical protein